MPVAGRVVAMPAAERRAGGPAAYGW
jgi:hypothetical protein